MTGHLIRRITKAEDGKTDVYGPYEQCATCGPLDRMTLDLLGAYRDLLAQQELDRLRAQRAAVLAIHRNEASYRPGGSCAHCRYGDDVDSDVWPCPTVRALEDDRARREDDRR
ncbi:MAG: hypothetical protein JWO67_3335 [Streptosporangiaceae bacterium]|nr:hypothetical protein [Streptosporangiaceae bacterium]